MKLYKREGYEGTTITTVESDDGKELGIIGMINDLVKLYASVDDPKCVMWGAIPLDEKKEMGVMESYKEAIKYLSE